MTLYLKVILIFDSTFFEKILVRAKLKKIELLIGIKLCNLLSSWIIQFVFDSQKNKHPLQYFGWF
jgi:hypothetical protein